LIEKSPTVRAMSPENRQAIVQIAMDASSEKARKVYDILLEEKARMEKVVKTFDQIATKVMDEMQAGIVKIKTKSGKEKLINAQEKARNEDTKEAEELLGSLN